MKNLKLLTAVTLLLAAAGAYAGTDDGNVANQDGDPGIEVTNTASAPAPSAAASADNKPVYDSGVISPTP